MSSGGQIYRGIPTGLLTGAADRKLLDSLGLRLILDLRSESEAAEQPDYVPDGARLVRICGLCLENGKEVDFSPEDRENLLKGMPDEGRRMADAMYERMLFGNEGVQGAVPCAGSRRDPHPVPLLGRQGPHRRGRHPHPAGAGRVGQDHR